MDQPTERQVRAAAEVLARELMYRSRSGWAREAQEVRDIYIERAIPVAREAFRAASLA